MGKSHAATGLAVGAGIGVAVFGLGSADWLIPSLAVCGAAVLPDIDEPDSSVSREFGIVSRGFSEVVNKISGGHRKLTHSLLGLGIVVALLVPVSFGRVACAVLFGLLAATAWRLMAPRWLPFRKMLFIFTGAAAGEALYRYHPISDYWFVLFVGVGWLVHMGGDYLTRGGIPLLYPRGGKSSFPIFGATGSTIETAFATALSIAVVVAIGFWGAHHYPAGTLQLHGGTSSVQRVDPSLLRPLTSLLGKRKQ